MQAPGGPEEDPSGGFTHGGWTQLIKGDVAKAVTKLRQSDGPEIQVHGSANLLQTLLAHELIDELNLWIFPLAFGTGKRLFGDGTIPGAFRLRDSTTSTTGVTIAIYEPAGVINYGSFALEEPTPAEIERRKRHGE